MKNKGLITFVGLALLLPTIPVRADTTTYLEDFNNTTYYDQTASDTFTTWRGGAQLMFDTVQSIPAPFYHKPSTAIQNLARSGNYIFAAYAPPSAGGKLQVFDTT
ncbi:MAG: hypothetical protein ACD_43C00077G0002, partial [uncultured bacterium]